MAKTTIVQVSDDLDGSANASEVRFAFEGTEYAIDLSSKNRKALEKALRPYVAAGTKVSGRRSGATRSARSKRSGNSGNSAVDLAAVRAWAKENGHQVSDRGRLPRLCSTPMPLLSSGLNCARRQRRPRWRDIAAAAPAHLSAQNWRELVRRALGHVRDVVASLLREIQLRHTEVSSRCAFCANAARISPFSLSTSTCRRMPVRRRSGTSHRRQRLRSFAAYGLVCAGLG